MLRSVAVFCTSSVPLFDNTEGRRVQAAFGICDGVDGSGDMDSGSLFLPVLLPLFVGFVLVLCIGDDDDAAAAVVPFPTVVVLCAALVAVGSSDDRRIGPPGRVERG